MSLVSVPPNEDVTKFFNVRLCLIFGNTILLTSGRSNKFDSKASIYSKIEFVYNIDLNMYPNVTTQKQNYL